MLFWRVMRGMIVLEGKLISCMLLWISVPYLLQGKAGLGDASLGRDKKGWI